MEPEPATKLQSLILRRLAEMGEVGRPMSLRDAAGRGGVLHLEDLRALARGERGEVLTVEEARALAAALDVTVREVEAATTVLPEV